MQMKFLCDKCPLCKIQSHLYMNKNCIVLFSVIQQPYLTFQPYKLASKLLLLVRYERSLFVFKCFGKVIIFVCCNEAFIALLPLFVDVVSADSERL